MFGEEKKVVNYLDQSIGQNVDEKSMQLIEAISGLTGGAKVLEIGPGGGAALMGVANEEIYRNGNGLKDISITTLEIFDSESLKLREVVDRLQKQGALVHGLIADAGHLPVSSESIDIVNCSAVFHEIFSYGGGKKALIRTLQEFDRVTKAGGKLLYRDVYPVDTSLHIPVEQVYERPSWVAFTKQFLPYYTSGPHQLYDNSQRIFSEHNGILYGQPPVGLAREIQRHYITLRDQVIRSGMLGLKVDTDRYDETEWVRGHNGFEKKIYLSSHDIDTVHTFGLGIQTDRTGSFVSATEFNDFVDNELEHFFKALNQQVPSAVSLWQNWLKREGRESYVYGSVSEVVDLIRTAGNICGNEEKFSITSPDHYVVAERDYYTDYLRTALGNCALPDRKLMITFLKV